MDVHLIVVRALGRGAKGGNVERVLMPADGEG